LKFLRRSYVIEITITNTQDRSAKTKTERLGETERYLYMAERDLIVQKIEDMLLEDYELKLRFEGKKQVTEPDSELQAYCFSMKNLMTEKEMGTINIKAGYTKNIVNYRGNIGFTVYEEYRGRHYSERSCFLLIPVICVLKMTPIWLTCDVGNIASIRNIERIGAVYVNTIYVPEDYHIYYPENARIKRRYKWEPEKI
jgi:predicted acetyltransferase